MYVSGISDHHNVFVNLVVMMYYCILQLGLALEGISLPHTFCLYIFFCRFFFFLMLISYILLAIVKLPILYCLRCIYLSYYVLQVSLFSLLFYFFSSQNIWDDAFFKSVLSQKKKKEKKLRKD